MFSGIIRTKGTVVKTGKSGVLSVLIAKTAGFKVKKGESVSVNGICSTVTMTTGKGFGVEYMEETERKTTAAKWKKGDIVNLEQSLRVGDILGGHIVQGHVDGVGKIMRIESQGDSKVYTIKPPAPLMKYIAKKGSVALNGVSLTVAGRDRHTFQVALIPYTLRETNLGTLRGGDLANIETDIIARHLEALLQH